MCGFVALQGLPRNDAVAYLEFRPILPLPQAELCHPQSLRPTQAGEPVGYLQLSHLPLKVTRYNELASLSRALAAS